MTRSPSILLLALLSSLTFLSPAFAESPLQFGPPTRLSDFRVGAPGDDVALRVDAVGDDFVAYWAHQDELRAVTVTGTPPHGDQATARKTAEQPSIGLQTCNDTACATVTQDYTGRYTVFITVVSRATGTSVRVEHTTLIPAAIASDPGGFAITDGLASHFLRIDNSGRVTTDVQFPAPPTSEIISGGAIAFNGDTYALFYSINFQVLAARTVRLDGTLVTLETRVMTTPLVPLTAGWNGSEYLLALSRSVYTFPIPERVEQNDLFAMRIAPNFTPLDAQPRQLATGGANTPVDIASNGRMFYVLWTRNYDALMQPKPHETVVEGAAIAATGELLSHDVLSLGPLPQEDPSVGQNPSTALVTWKETDMRTPVSSLRYAIVNRATQAEVAEGELDTANQLITGDVVPLGGDFLIVWRSSNVDAPIAHAAIIRQNGTRIDLAVPPWYFIEAAANSDHWLIAGATPNAVQSASVTRAGAVSAAVTITPGTAVTGLASDNERFLAAGFNAELLDRDGKLITLTNDRLEDVDFGGDRYAGLTLNGAVLLQTFDRNMRQLTSTPVAPLTFVTGPVLTHIGPWFITMYGDSAHTEYASLVRSDGTLTARDVVVPRGAIARTDTSTSTAVQILPALAGSGLSADGLFVSSVRVQTTSQRRAVAH
jgi:hypothetical protein